MGRFCSTTAIAFAAACLALTATVAHAEHYLSFEDMLTAPRTSNRIQPPPSASLARVKRDTEALLKLRNHSSASTTSGVDGSSSSSINGENVEVGVNHGILFGLFAPGCQEDSWFDPTTKKDDIQLTSFKTLEYNETTVSGSTFEVDYVEYAAEPGAKTQCHPARSDPYAKYHMWGTFRNHGVSQVDHKSFLGEWFHEKSAWLFPEKASPRTRQIVSLLNSGCKCGGVWKPGVARLVDAQKDCTEAERTAKDQFYLCSIVTGQTGYATFRWLNAQQYTSSAIRFDQNEGWNGVPTSPPRTKIVETGSNEANECNYLVWNEYGSEVREAQEFCTTCDSLDAAMHADRHLECYGCLDRHLGNNFGKVCPCLWYEADKLNLPWLRAPC